MWHELTQPALIDTDIGDHVDDAFGLALALKLPRLCVHGITTVAGPVQARAQLAQVILAAAACGDVPVAAGSSVTSDGHARSAGFSHQPVLDSADYTVATSSSSKLQSAVDLILACAHDYAPLTIIALGPLTNIAAALERDPTLARRARLVAMSGKLGLPYPGTNLRGDPHAARQVLASGMPITLVGVTKRSKMRPEQLQRLFASRSQLGTTLARCVLAWRTWRRRFPILHDALAVAVAADPTLVRLAPRQVYVGWHGLSLVAPSFSSNALICTAVDIERFHTLLDTHLLGEAADPAERRSVWQRMLGLVV